MAKEKDSGLGIGSLLIAGAAGAAAGYFFGSSSGAGGSTSPARSLSSGSSPKSQEKAKKKEILMPVDTSEWSTLSEEDVDEVIESSGHITSGSGVELMNTSLDDLTQMLGEPMEGDGDKTRYQWYVAPVGPEDFNAIPVFGYVTVYDYGEIDEEEDEEAPPPTTWSIGAPGKNAAERKQYAQAFVKWLRRRFKEDGLGTLRSKARM